MNVLVLDGDNKSGLACVRSLGARRIPVYIIANGKSSISSASQYVQKNLPNVCKLSESIDSLKDQVLLYPMTDIAMVECFEYQEKENRKHCILPFGSYQAYKQLSNKTNLFRMAHDLNISCPKTLFSSGKNIDLGFGSILEEVRYPAVLKPSLSRIFTPDGWRKTGVKYAKNRNELLSLGGSPPFSTHPFLIQERIQGPGIGVFLLTKQGRMQAYFAHLRIREKPPSGGVSVVCESIEPPKEALEAAKHLFAEVGWTGVGMVEFKLDKRDNRPKLMEVNARFWGSLQLAVAAGVDFPYLLYKMSLGEDCCGPDSYRTGLRSRWELGDLDHLLIRLKNRASSLSLPEGAPSRIQVLLDYCLDFLRPSVKSEIFRWSDPKPFFYEFKQYLRNLRS